MRCQPALACYTSSFTYDKIVNLAQNWFKDTNCMSLYKEGFLVIEAKGGIEEFPIAMSVCGTGVWGLSNIPEDKFCYSLCVECEGNPLPLLTGKYLAGYAPPNLEINYHTSSNKVPPDL